MSESQNGDQHRFSGHGWKAKFQNAFRGLGCALLDRGNRWSQNSFLVHIPAAIVVLLVAWQRQLSAVSIAVLALCAGMVLVAELFNSSLESLAKAITRDTDPHIKMSLDIASSAVLVASLFAVAVGCLVLFAA